MGMGHVSRFQGWLFTYTHTGTVQEISEVSCPGPVKRVSQNSPLIQTVKSTLGVYSNCKGSETDGFTQGYKDPPVPRRLVGESQIPPNLSPAYPRTSSDVSEFALASEFGKIRTGPKTGLLLPTLPVLPSKWPGPTHPGQVAGPIAENTGTLVPSGLSGPGTHVPDRSANSDRETSSPWPSTHETHIVASQKQLKSL